MLFFKNIYSYIQCVNQHRMTSAHCVHNVCICVHFFDKKSAVCHRIIQISLVSGEDFTSRGQMREKKNRTISPFDLQSSVFCESQSAKNLRVSSTNGNFLKSSRNVIIYSFISHWPFIYMWLFEILSLSHGTFILKSSKIFQNKSIYVWWPLPLLKMFLCGLFPQINVSNKSNGLFETFHLVCHMTPSVNPFLFFFFVLFF